MKSKQEAFDAVIRIEEQDPDAVELCLRYIYGGGEYSDSCLIGCYLSDGSSSGIRRHGARYDAQAYLYVLR